MLANLTGPALEVLSASPMLADASGVLPATAAAALLAGWGSMFHSPHDVISDVHVTHDSARRKVVFAVSRCNLLRSEDDQSWERLTTGLGAYKLSAIAVSPAFSHDSTVFVASFGGGVFRSSDGGGSWRQCNVGLPQAYIVQLAIAPDFALSGVVIALGLDGVIYGSHDSGATWRTVLDARPDPTAGAGVPAAAAEVLANPLRDAGDSWALCHQPTGATCLACSSGNIVAGTSYGHVLSTSGLSDAWTHLATLPQERRISCIAVTPASGDAPGCVLIGTDADGIFTVPKDGGRLAKLPVPRPLKRVTALAAWTNANGGTRFAAAAWDDALFLSDDGGRKWTHVGAGLTKHRQADERRFGAPHFNVIALDNDQAPQACYVGGFDGLFRSGDFINAWQPVETLAARIAIDLAVAPEGATCSVAVSTYGAGLALHRDSSSGWQSLTPSVTARRLGPVCFSPAAGSGDPTLFVGGEGALLRRDAAASNWQRAPMSPVMGRHRSARLFQHARSAERFAAHYLPASAVGLLKRGFQVAALRLGGRVSRIVFPSAIEFSKHFMTNRTMLVGTREHGIFRSTDGGRTLVQVWDAGGRFVRKLQSATRGTSETFFALLPDGLHFSDDGGLHWNAAPPGVRGALSTLAASPGFAEDTTLFIAGSGGLFRSGDAGRTWAELPLGIPAAGAEVWSIEVSPDFDADGLLLVYVRGFGLLRSGDRGDHFELVPWTAAASDPGFCTPNCFPDATTLVRFSPGFKHDRRLLAARMGQVYMSKDVGSTWTELS